jgi:dihydrolipoamide dehydrogenase
MQQVTLAVRARVPLGVLRDTIQPFPSFSQILASALKALDREIKAGKASLGVQKVPVGSISK